ncbi:hypothetical protein [Leptospira kirschneri]|uniref:hypothetical protein n=3 Tax=Leptospira kirschneri TaxID=29507 RepID=UPI00028A0ABA|nr:hypothetical protein [Leptospira kirschneri]OOV47082.1 hypothetical protein B1J94_16980 [Leptospira kirschneri serovar Grippotyphosa]
MKMPFKFSTSLGNSNLVSTVARLWVAFKTKAHAPYHNQPHKLNRILESEESKTHIRVVEKLILELFVLD